jgi:hypothetical protein
VPARSHAFIALGPGLVAFDSAIPVPQGVSRRAGDLQSGEGVYSLAIVAASLDLGLTGPPLPRGLHFRGAASRFHRVVLCRLFAYAFLGGGRTVVLAIQALSRVLLCSALFCSVAFRVSSCVGSVSLARCG